MDWNKIFDKENALGHGFPVGNDDDDINAIEGIGELVKSARSDDDVAVYQDGNRYIIVGDANGPWAIEWEIL